MRSLILRTDVESLKYEHASIEVISFVQNIHRTYGRQRETHGCQAAFVLKHHASVTHLHSNRVRTDDLKQPQHQLGAIRVIRVSSELSIKLVRV